MEATSQSLLAAAGNLKQVHEEEEVPAKRENWRNLKFNKSLTTVSNSDSTEFTTENSKSQSRF